MKVFFHLPKCAGTSLKDALDGHFNRLVLDHFPYEQDNGVCLRVHVDDWSRPVELIYVHEWVLSADGFVAGFKLDPADTSFAFLRHPVALLRSMYFYLRKEQCGPFLRGLTSTHHTVLLFELIRQSGSFEQFVDQLLAVGARLPGCVDVLLAYFDDRLLSKLTFVGVEEKMGPSVARLNCLLDLPEGFSVAHKNANDVYDRAGPIHRFDELCNLLGGAVRVYEAYAARVHQA